MISINTLCSKFFLNGIVAKSFGKQTKMGKQLLDSSSIGHADIHMTGIFYIMIRVCKCLWTRFLRQESHVNVHRLVQTCTANQAKYRFRILKAIPQKRDRNVWKFFRATKNIFQHFTECLHQVNTEELIAEKEGS